MRTAMLLAIVLGFGACADDVDEPYFLDHDRIIAVRASTPRIASGESATLDALIGKKGAPPDVETPAQAMVVSPQSLAGALTNQGGAWTVTAPDAATLDAARTELKLEAGAAVPLTVGVAYLGTTWPSGEVVDGLAAIKTVWLGEHAENPTLTGLTIDGEDLASKTDLVIDGTKDVETHFSVTIDEEAGDDVTWLSTVGTVHDYDLATSAYITVEDEDLLVGDFAIVVRTENGGVVWQTWTIRAE